MGKVIEVNQALRILFVTQWFEPEPFFKGLPFAQELQRRGHTVQVLTGFPNYPGGKLYQGYRVRFWQREMMEGISIIRVPLYPSHDQSSIKRVVNYASFALSATILGTALVKKADVMYVYHPPATIGLPAMAISLLRGIPFVYDVQDLWPDTLSSTGMLKSPGLLKAVGRWCKLVYRRAARVAVLSPGFKVALVERGVPERKVAIIYNWCDESQAKELTRDESLIKALGLSGKFVVLFAGTIGKAQGMDSVLDAARILKDELPAARFVFVGGGIEVGQLKRRVAGEGIDNVVFVPRQPTSKIGRYLALADVLLVHLRRDRLFEISIPSKTQTYLAVGKPILMAVDGDAADLVSRAGAGIACEPENPRELARAVEKMYRMNPDERYAMGTRGKTCYQNGLSQHVGVTKFEQLFQEAVGQ